LREERWETNAVGLWIEHTGIAVDVYPSVELALAADIALAKLEIQFQPFSLPDVPSLRTTVTELATGLG